MTLEMTLEQQRAAFAWKRAEGGDYRNLAKGAPAFVMANGLMQALAFWKSKDQDHHKDLLKHLLEWLQKQKLLEQLDFAGAMRELQNMDAHRHRRATDEALAILKWLRLYASAKQGKGSQ